MGPDFLSRMQRRVEELSADEERNPSPESRREANARRLNNLVDKGEVFREAITRKEVLERTDLLQEIDHGGAEWLATRNPANISDIGTPIFSTKTSDVGNQTPFV